MNALPPSRSESSPPSGCSGGARPASPQISVIIVNWNSKAYVRRCLHSLMAHSQGLAPEVVVVDSGSFDGCDQLLAREFPTAIFVQSSENIGFARANNLGARHAGGRYLLFLNPDTEFIENTVRILCDRLASLPGAGAVGCRLLNGDRTLQTSCVQSFPTVVNQILDSEYLRHRFPRSRLWGTAALCSERPEPAEVEALSGACILAKRECFESVGGFTESYFMYGEDLDFCFRLRQAGFKVFHLPETSLVHFGGGSTRRAASNSSAALMRESVFRFMRANRGMRAALAYRFSMVVTALVRVLLIGPMLLFGNRVVDHGSDSLRKWTAVLRWSLGLAPSTWAPPQKGGASVVVRTKPG